VPTSAAWSSVTIDISGSRQSNRYEAANKTEITSKRNTYPFFMAFTVLNGGFATRKAIIVRM
jgi:hypothetical protein